MDMSARLGTWFIKKGIGKEKIVAIRVPRGVRFVATRLAAMMTGSAWVGVEDMMGEERIAYIIKDSGADLIVDDPAFEEAMGESPLPVDQWADPDNHDLAFVYYTSGSTGRAKGVLEEYGVYDYIIHSTYRSICRYMPVDYANIAPETFIGGIYLMSGILMTGNTLHLIPLTLVRNPAGLLEYFKKHEITATCMPPTLVKALEAAGGMNLKVLHITGEIAVDLYVDRYPMMNAYGPTEFSYLPFFFDMDKAYKNTPIGTPDENTKLVLLDEYGHKTENEGMLCMNLPYFRGYLHDENNSDNFITIDGERYFKTSDYVSVDEKGNFTILGRADDMVKINGNRIEPAEVEFAVREVLHTDFAAVKAWERGGSRYLCAYHTTGKKLNAAEMAKELKTRLPIYMIPSCYVAIDDIPLNENGKVNKKVLPEPDESAFFAPYAAPENDLQKSLCSSFARVLNIEESRIGIDDDFFLLGGDSLRAMEVLTDADIPGLSVQLIYEGRTPREIASLIHVPEGAPQDAGEITESVPLNIGQQYLLAQDLKYPGSCMLNLPVRFNVLPSADLEELQEAILTAVQAHPALQSIIEEKDGTWFLKYRPEAAFTFPVEEMTDEELEKTSADFVKPFSLDGEPLFRCRIIKGGSRSVVLMDIYHVICDGFSLMKLIDDIGTAVDGEPIGTDWNYRLLKEEAESRSSEKFRKDMEFFAKRYDHSGWVTCPKPDHESDKNTNNKIFLPFDFEQKETAALEKKYGLGKNGMYLAATALAIASSSSSEDIMFTWTWHGRSDGQRMNSVGYFCRDLPIALHLKQGLTLSGLFEDIGRQVSAGISHGSVSYWEEKGSYNGNELVCFLYQGDFYEYHDREDVVSDAAELQRPAGAGYNLLDVELLDGKDSFGIQLSYNAEKYEQQSIESFGRRFCELCAKMIRLNPNTVTVGDILSDTDK